MKKVVSLWLLVLFGVADVGHAASSGAGELPLAGVHGGALQDPVIAGNFVHIPSGRIVTTWDYSDPAAPAMVASTALTPASGVIRGLTRWGDYLYASWQAGDDTGGVAVYSLRDPARPELVNEFSDYAPSMKNLWTLAAAKGYLYLFDAENGIYYGDLGPDPLHPTFQRLLRTPIPYSRSQVDGDYLYVSGTTINSDPFHICSIIDLRTPAAPALLASDCGNGNQPEHFRSRIQSPYAAVFGLKFNLYDISEPAAPQMLGSIDTDPATDGFIAGNYAYSLGFAEIAIHDISNPMAPETIGYSPVSTLGADSVTPLDGGALVLTSTDRFIRLDVAKTPIDPIEASVATPTGGIVPRDIALVNNKALILQENYGLSTADQATLAPLDRFEASLPQALNQRDFEQFAVDGERAYLAAWGYGLIVVELSFARPFELGRLEFPGVSSVAARGNYVYLGTTTGGGVLQVVDVSVPEKPTLRGSLTVPGINRLQVHGSFVYAADELSGVHVFDVSNPDAPVQVTVWNDGCANAGGYSAQDIELNDAGTLAAVGCPTGLQLLDLSRPGSPTRVGGHAATSAWATPRVAIKGNRAWYADADGLKAFDITSPSSPVQVGAADLASLVPRRLRATGDGRVFAFGNVTGMHVFGQIESADRIFADGFDEGSGKRMLATDGAFESLHRHATQGSNFTPPRVMVDNIPPTPATP